MTRLTHRMAISLVLLSVSASAVPSLAQQDLPGLPAVTAPEAIRPEDLFAFEPYTHTFRVTEGEGSGADTQVRLEQRDEGWLLIVGEFYRLYLAQREDGALMMTRMDILERGEAAVYEPAVTFLPQRLEAGTSLTLTGRVTIYDLQTRQRTHRGTYTHRLIEASRVTLNVPAGRMKGYLVEYDHRMDLGLGQVRLDMETGWVPGIGLAYLRQKSTFEALVIFGQTTIRMLALAERPQ